MLLLFAPHDRGCMRVGLVSGEKQVLELGQFSLAIRSTLASLEQSARSCGIFADGVRYRIEVVVLQDLLVFWAPQELGDRILVYMLALTSHEVCCGI